MPKALLFLLNDEERRPQIGTGAIDFDHLQEVLLVLSVSVGIHLKPGPAAAQRGRRPLAWRDELVATVCAIYREETPKRVTAETIELLLGWLGADIDDVEKAMTRSRQRQERPRLKVTMHRPIKPGFQAPTNLNQYLAELQRAIEQPPTEAIAAIRSREAQSKKAR